jgi:hypothetical protein
MKKDIHPEYIETQVTCTCGASSSHPAAAVPSPSGGPATFRGARMWLTHR